MSITPYDLSVNSSYEQFEFVSEGPKGAIKKVIRYTRLKQFPEDEIYNLGFGDELPDGKISDSARSNNADRDKVLTTVAISVLRFLQQHPDAMVAFKGSTDARTRTYIMSMTKYWDTLDELVVVQGFTGKGWEFFRKNGRYSEVVISRKIS